MADKGLERECMGCIEPFDKEYPIKLEGTIDCIHYNRGEDYCNLFNTTGCDQCKFYIPCNTRSEGMKCWGGDDEE